MLFILDDLCHEFSFRPDFFSYKSIAFHVSAAAAYLSLQRQVEDEGVARYYFLAEFYIVDFHEVGRVALGLLYGIEYEQPSGLCHGLDNEYTRHNRLGGEVSLEEGFVARYVLYAYNLSCTHFYYLIEQEERLAEGEQGAYAVGIH